MPTGMGTPWEPGSHLRGKFMCNEASSKILASLKCAFEPGGGVAAETEWQAQKEVKVQRKVILIKSKMA